MEHPPGMVTYGRGMLKARLTSNDGRPLLVFGLTYENVVRLQEGHPILVDLDDLEAGPGQVVITYGLNTRELMAQIRQVDPRIPENVPEPEPGQAFRVTPKD